MRLYIALAIYQADKTQVEWNLNEATLCTKRKVISTLGMSTAKQFP